jgi:hypothetical protein
MQRQKLQGLSIEEVKLQLAKPRAVPKNMPRLHFLCAMVGSRMAGKTNLMLNIVRLYDTTHSFDKVILISRSLQSDPKYEILKHGSYEYYAYPEYSHALMKTIIDSINKDIEEAKIYLEYKKVYTKLLRVKNVELLNDDEMSILESKDFQDPKELEGAKWNGNLPTTLLIMDDLSGSSLYQHNFTNIANQFFIRHRHSLTSCMFLCQVFKNGVPRGIRNNLTWWILFRNKSEKVQREVAEEVTTFIHPDELVKIWNIATAENPWDFFMMDMDVKDPNLRFRKNLDEPFVLES